MKKCSSCKKLKPETEFYKRGFLSNGTIALKSSCKACNKIYQERYLLNPDKAKLRAMSDKIRNRKIRIENPERASKRNRKNNLKHYHDISLGDYAALFHAQNGVCAICKKPESTALRGKTKNLSVDHCHVSGKIRGLLCNRCNRAIGLLGDDVDLIANALSYLLNPIQNPIIPIS